MISEQRREDWSTDWMGKLTVRCLMTLGRALVLDGPRFMLFLIRSKSSGPRLGPFWFREVAIVFSLSRRHVCLPRLFCTFFVVEGKFCVSRKISLHQKRLAHGVRVREGTEHANPILPIERRNQCTCGGNDALLQSQGLRSEEVEELMRSCS
eukprot:g76762.t1